MGPSEIAVVQISRSKYIMKCYHDMVDQIPPKRILWLWNQWESHCLHRRHLIWNSRTSGASRHQNTGELPLEQKVNLHQVGDPIKRHTDLFKYWYIYIVCVELAIFVGKDNVPQNSAFKHPFKHTTWSTMLSPCKRWRHSDAVQLTRSGSRKKNWRVHFLSFKTQTTHVSATSIQSGDGLTPSIGALSLSLPNR